MNCSTPNLSTRRVGVLLLVSWLCAIPGLLPGILATLAWCEGSHGVEVGFFNENVSVVLTHHADGTKCHDAIHRHGVTARLIASFAQPDSDGPDHVLGFAGGARTESPVPSLVPDQPMLAALAPWLQPKSATSDLEHAVGVQAWHALGKPPAHLIEIRSTLLRI